MSWFSDDGRWGTGTGYCAENFWPIPIPTSLLVSKGLPAECAVVNPSPAGGLGRGIVRSRSPTSLYPVGVQTSVINLSIEQQIKSAGVNIGGVQVDVDNHLFSSVSSRSRPDSEAAPVLSSSVARGFLDVTENVQVTAVDGPCDATDSVIQFGYGKEPVPDIECEASFPPLLSNSCSSRGAEGGHEPACGKQLGDQLVSGSCYVRGATADCWSDVLEFASQFGRVIDSTTWQEGDVFTGWLRFEDAEKLNWLLEVTETSPPAFFQQISFEC